MNRPVTSLQLWWLLYLFWTKGQVLAIWPKPCLLWPRTGFWPSSQFLSLLKDVCQPTWTSSSLGTWVALSCVRAVHIQWPPMNCSSPVLFLQFSWIERPDRGHRWSPFPNWAEPSQHCFLSQPCICFCFRALPQCVIIYSFVYCLLFLPLDSRLKEGRHLICSIRPYVLKAWKSTRYTVGLY